MTTSTMEICLKLEIGNIDLSVCKYDFTTIIIRH